MLISIEKNAEMSAELKPLPPSTASVSSTEKAHLEYSLKSLATILPLKSKLSGKFQRCNVIEIVEFPKMSIKIKTFKTFCESQTTIYLKKIIRNLPPYQIKVSYVSGIKVFKR